MGFCGELRANTAVDVLIGPFVDDTDGKTAETGLTLSQADIKLSKLGQALAQKNDDTAAAADANGYYNCELDATDTNTEGTLTLIVHESGALPVRHDFMVLAEAAWDSKYVAKDDGFMDVNIKTVGRADTQETEANNLEAACANYSATRGLTGTAVPAAAADAAGGLVISAAGGLDVDAMNANVSAVLADTGTDGVVVAAASKTGYSLAATGADLILKSSIFVQAIVAAINEFATYGLTALNTLLVTTGIKAASIPAATLADDAITASKFDESTAFPLKSADTGATALARTGADADTLETLSDQIDGVPAASANADAVWDEALAGHLGAGSTGNALNAAGSAGDPWSTALPGAYGTGTAGKLVGDNLNAPVATVDTVVDAIKAKTDNLPTDPADQSAVEAAITAAAAPLATATELAKVPKSDGVVTWNATALASVQASAAAALTAYDPPTNAEMEARTLPSADYVVVTDTLAAVTTVTDKAGYALSAAGVDAILDEAITEPAGMFAWASATLRNIIGILGALARNKQTLNKDTGLGVLRNDADDSNVSSRTDTDDGSVYTRGEWA